MIVDTETHPFIFARPSNTNQNWSMVKHYTWHEHSPELLVAEMDQAGVQKAATMPRICFGMPNPRDCRWRTLQVARSTVVEAS